MVHSCLIEDTALFLRYALEKVTRERQDEMFGLLRRLLRFFPQLPQQTAFTLHNYLIGFIMFYVRSPVEGSQELVGNALSLLSIVRCAPLRFCFACFFVFLLQSAPWLLGQNPNESTFYYVLGFERVFTGFLPSFGFQISSSTTGAR